MKQKKILLNMVIAASVLGFAANSAAEAPDQERLGKSAAYPIGNAGNWFLQEWYRVGSFTHQAEIPDLYKGKVNRLLAADKTRVLALPKAANEPDYRWHLPDQKNLKIDDFLARQRIMGLLIIKDGEIQLERYQYQRNATQLFTSQSMAKSITSLALGLALSEAKIKSLSDSVVTYVPEIEGSAFAELKIQDLLRMSAGLACRQVYDGKDDNARFSAAIRAKDIEHAAFSLSIQEFKPGSRFHYCSPNTHILSSVLRHATGQTLAEYLTPRLWQAIGAENDAYWRADRHGTEVAGGNFNATLRDYGRLGVVLANNGVRPDDSAARQIIPLDYLLEATDAKQVPQAFKPGQATPYFGYGYQFWLYPGAKRRFALIGVFGQAMFIDPELHLVMLMTAANATASAAETSLARERDALWRGVVQHYGPW